ncbi:MAG: CHC2 zinc finger domain-containing protein [Acidobacteriota bacterium]
MLNTLSKDHLRELRNRIEMIPLIAEVLELLYKTQDGRFRFMCPLCQDFDTAVNLATNLARCFRCQRNFNPIDMVMTVKRYSFLQAVHYLQPLLDQVRAHARNRPHRLAPPIRTHS